MKTRILMFCLLISNLLYAQQDYDLLYLKGEYNTILDKSKKLETNDDYFWYSLILDKQGKTLEAIELLENGITKFDTVTILTTLLSDYLYKTGQYSKAKPFLAKHADNPDKFLKYINVLEFQGEYNVAIELLEKELLKDTLNLDYLTHIGDNYFQIDSIKLAITAFSKLLSINPNDQLIASKLANILIKDKDYSKAIEVCNTGLSRDSTNKKLIKLKGIASFSKTDFQIAESCFNYLYEQGDSNKFILKHLGVSKFNNSSFKDSRELLLQAFQLDPNDFEVCYMLGKCYLNSPEPEKGLYFFDRVDSLLQPNPKTLSTLYSEKQSIYIILNRPEEALLCYQKAYSYTPKPEYIFYIASLYQRRLNNPDSALINYERFLSLLPEKSDTIPTGIKKGQMTITLRSVAESNIIKLKEDLFFEGKLE